MIDISFGHNRNSTAGGTASQAGLQANLNLDIWRSAASDGKSAG